MSQGIACTCAESKKPIAERNWGVSQRHQRCSAFDGYHPMYSDYSAIRCLSCGYSWRTKAVYVDQLRTISFAGGDFQFVVL